MKRYTKTFWNGMLEDPKGEWVKEKEAKKSMKFWASKFDDKELENVALFNKLSDEEHTSFIYAWICLLSLLGNIGQLLYQMNT